jgi:uncharacterized membrane protein YkoI
VCLPAVYEGRHEGGRTQREGREGIRSPVTIEHAIKAASEKVQETVIEAEWEKTQEKTIWEVEVVTTDGTVLEAIVDNETGAVTTGEKKKSDMECCL